ncbi:CAF17-like 4Fe-4S cluster assembly/insertion protein YgfZ [Vogesella fluminis]|uniref:Folate-binding protein YgfZ n=1 Tax=Vogesella fluminis TaxID=1069161 RepID=A0ABQ3HA56_9NEIS|nr:folate-binding protein YgfZ [Vogesella fluminis]GHD72194.1 folate-binding protein YgfZ [Vogesella fluminis]
MNQSQVSAYLTRHGAMLDAEGDVVLTNSDSQGVLPFGQDGHAILTQFVLLTVHGDDAESFLQGQFSSDVKLLDGTVAQWSSYSNAKGRMQASFLLWRLEQKFFLLLRKDIAETFRRRLSMFVLRAKVKIEVADSVIAGEYLAAPETGLAVFEPTLAGTAEHAVVSIGTQIRIFCLSAEKDAILPAFAGKLLPSKLFDIFFIRAGIPWVSRATYEAFIPQMANLDLIGGISFRKGCYPGQEIVARTQYLGKVKRRMFMVEISSTNCTAGMDVQTVATGEQTIGKVMLSVPVAAGKYLALVVMQISGWGGQPYLAGDLRSLLLRQELPYAIPDMQ